MTKFKVEVKHGQVQRLVEADSFDPNAPGGWVIFYRKPATGGALEHWRVRLESVVCMETMR